MVKDRGQKQCFQGGEVQITKFKGPGILQSTLGWLEAGQNFQGIPYLEGLIPETPHSQPGQPGGAAPPSRRESVPVNCVPWLGWLRPCRLGACLRAPESE